MREWSVKRLGVCALALLLVAGTTVALADDRHRGGRHDRPHWNHYKKHHYIPYRPHYRYPYRGPRYYRGYRPRYYYPPYPPYAGALIGSAIFYSLFHTHDGTYCYEDHGRQDERYRESGRREIVGCHRIERLPDGRERRIEVPLSECH